MDTPERAADLFDSGWNCAESSFRALVEGQPGAETWTRAAATFGGGLAWRGHVCGAVTGCAMAVGVLRGRAAPSDADAKARSYAIVTALMDRLEARFGSIQCRTLTGLDFTRPEDRVRYWERVHHEVCLPMVEAAVGITMEELEREAPAGPRP